MTKPVVGKRLSFWQGMEGWELLFSFVVSPICVVLAVRWFVDLRNVEGGLFSDRNFGGTVMGGLFALAGLGVGALGVKLFRIDQQTGVIVSACPVCGVEKQRDFTDATTKRPWPEACGACLAYLRVNLKTLEVREESLNASDEMRTYYSLAPAQYTSIVPRGEGEARELQFEMPAICAVCGAADAGLLRDIGDANRKGDTGDVTDALLWRSQRIGVIAGSQEPSEGERLDASLRHLKTPVCAKHTQKTYRGDALAYGSGTLWFASYRYYQAFCALNHITAGYGTSTNDRR